MSVRNIGNRSVQELFNSQKRLAIIAASMAGIIFGVVLFGN